MSATKPKPERPEPAPASPPGNKGVFDALLGQAVPDEASPPEGETSDPE